MKNKTSHKISIGLCLLLVFVLIGAAIYIIYFFKPLEQPDFDKYKQDSILESPMRFDKKTSNILICGLDESENLTDVIMIASFDFVEKKVNILQIPRDSYVGEEFVSGKINSVYSQNDEDQSKIGSLIEQVNKMLKIYIDGYATITLDSFSDLVDKIGGVEISVENDLFLEGGVVLKEGLNHLDGAAAQTFVRHRKSYINADIGRIAAQEEFLKALFEKMVTIDISTITSFVVDNFSEISTSFSVFEVLKYQDFLKSISLEDIEFFLLEGYGVMNNGYAVYSIDKDKAIKMLNENFRTDKTQVDNLDIIEIYE